MVAPHVAVLAAGMLVAGTINTVATKFQDLSPVGGCYGPYFYHPALQSAAMFLGEATCLVGAALHASRGRAAARASGAPPPASRATWAAAAAFALPAACDAAATTALNVGLAMTSASSFQMLRGTLVAWAGLFTQVLLRRRLRPHHWFGVALIVAGAAVVGASAIVYEGGSEEGAARGAPPSGRRASKNDNPALGVALIVASQAMTALQFIVEEALLSRHRVPALLAVGLEGVWGLAICGAALPVLSHSFTRPDGSRTAPIDDVVAGLSQVAASPRLAASMAVTVASIAAFNACGLSVTKRLSGAARAATDACRTLAVWAVALAAGWEAYGPGVWLKVLGFALLLTGAALFNGLVRACLPRVGEEVGEEAEAEEGQPLLVEEGLPPPLLPPHPPRRHAAPLAAARPPAHSHYTLARSMRLPPAALSPHSLLDPTPSSAALLGRSESGAAAMEADSEAEASGHGRGEARAALREGEQE